MLHLVSQVLYKANIVQDKNLLFWHKDPMTSSLENQYKNQQ